MSTMSGYTGSPTELVAIFSMTSGRLSQHRPVHHGVEEAGFEDCWQTCSDVDVQTFPYLTPAYGQQVMRS